MSTKFVPLTCTIYPNNADNAELSELLQTVTDAWTWNRIEPVLSGADEQTEIGKRFFADDTKYLQIACESSGRLSIDCGSVEGPSVGSVLSSYRYSARITVGYNEKCFVLASHEASVNTDREKGAQLDFNTGYIVVGSATNQLTQERGTAIAVFATQMQSSGFYASSARIIADDTETADALRSSYTVCSGYVFGARYTDLMHAGNTQSAYTMDDVYFMPRCQLSDYGNNVASELRGHQYRIFGWLAFDEEAET